MLAVRRGMRDRPEPDRARVAVDARLSARLWTARARRRNVEGSESYEPNGSCACMAIAAEYTDEMRDARRDAWGHLADNEARDRQDRATW